jgi:cytochrome c oxidase cbb3-type subunit 2
MPTWHEIPERDRLAVITYIKTFSKRWKAEKPEPPVPIPDPPTATLNSGWAKSCLSRRSVGSATATTAKAMGRQPISSRMISVFRFGRRTSPRGNSKGGSSVSDVYRTMTTGLDGTPMPSFIDSMKDDERWAISYYVLSFSAWADL